MTDDAIILDTLKFIDRKTNPPTFVNIQSTLWYNFDIKKQQHFKSLLLTKGFIQLNTINQWEFQLRSEGFLAIEPLNQLLEKEFLIFISNQPDIEWFMVNHFIKPDPKSENTINETDNGVNFLQDLKGKGLIDYQKDDLDHVNKWYVDDNPPTTKRWFDTLEKGKPMLVSLTQLGKSHLLLLDKLPSIKTPDEQSIASQNRTLYKINIILDNLFGSDADAIVIPRSTKGSIGDGFKKGIKEIFGLDIPEFKYSPIGTLEIINYSEVKRLNKHNPSIDIIYVTTVGDSKSGYSVVEDIIKKIGGFTVLHPNVRNVATPLLGTGAGNLNPVEVFKVIKEQFTINSRQECTLDIFIKDETIYNQIVGFEKLIAAKNTITERYQELNESDRKDEFLNYLITNPCYLVGSSWGGTNDQSQRFFRDGIWEHDRDNKFTTLVKSIEPGSVLFLKSTFANGKKSYLRIKGAGIVTTNPLTGKLLDVDWKVKDVQYDIADRGSYRSTVAKVNDKAIKEILGSLADWELFQNRLFGDKKNWEHDLVNDNGFTEELESNEIIENRNAIESTFLTDYYADTDLLNYELYASAIVSFINHKNTKPPLTIGIMAPWGKGKTSLMHFIEKKLKTYKSTSIKEQPKKENRIRNFFKVDHSNDTATFNLFIEWINKSKERFIYGKTLQYPTVWFNAWKFQKNEQIWAGFAYEIINQLVDQLPNPLAKEEFWLRLNLKRVDQEKLKNKIRLKLYNKLLTQILGLVISGAVIIFCILFHIQAIVGWLTGGSISLVTLISYFRSKLKVENEKVDFDITKFIRQPDYESKRGFFHEVEQDLRDVMNILVSETKPAVIFIDDLDRCAPNTVAEVVEAINLFISGDFPKCYFILGQDAQMVAASLDVAYDKIGDKSSGLYREQGSLGWHFMEKFIQLQFCIPIISEEQSKVFFKSFFNLKVNPTDEMLKEEVLEKVKELEVKIEATKNINQLFTSDTLRLEEELKIVDPIRAVKLQEQIIEKAATEYDDNDPEVLQLIEQLAAYVGSSPRTIKRFINLYRFYKFLQFTNRNTKLQHTTSYHLGQWIVFMIRWPQLVRAIQWNTESEFIVGNTALERAQKFETLILQYNYGDWEEVIDNRVPGSKWLKDIELYKFIRICKKDNNKLEDAVEMGVW